MNRLRGQKIRAIFKVVESFFLKPASARPLAVLRIGLALILIAQAYYLRSSVLDFFSKDGLIQGDLAPVLGIPNTPKISFLANFLAPYGIEEATCIYAVCWLYLGSAILFGIGLWTRVSSVLTFMLHWILICTGFTTAYGVDLYVHVFLFYLMWMPVGDAFSADSWLSGKSFAKAPSSSARLSLRVLQIHLCLSYFFSAIEKSKGEQWWNGELLWRALNLPVYQQFDLTWLVNWPLALKLGGLASLFLEMGYIVFIWPRLTRKFWVAGIVGMHLGIAVFLGLGLFGAIMCVLTFSIFGISSEPVEIREGELPGSILAQA